MIDLSEIKQGQRVRIHSEVDRREGNWHSVVEGTVVETLAKKTGSWNAHGKEDRLWLNRILIRKPDGEQSLISVDQHTRIELL